MEQFFAQYGMIIILVVLFLIMVIPSILKSRKELKAREDLNASIKKGTKVITTAGIYGTVTAMAESSDGTIVTISTGDVNHPSTITMHINAIGGIDNKTMEKTKKSKKEEKEEETIEDTSQDQESIEVIDTEEESKGSVTTEEK